MSKIKIVNTPSDSIVMMIQSDIIMTATGVYETVNPISSIMDDTSANILEYSS